MPIEEAGSVADPLFANFTTWGTAAAAAWVAALSASGHCAVMCGPLACGGTTTTRQARWKLLLSWNAGRVVAYATVGAWLGGLGQSASLLISQKVGRVLPWVMAAGLVVAAFDLGKRLRLPRALAQVAHVVLRSGAGFSPLASRFIAGAATPFLPCGVLWGGYLAALGTGSVVGGALVMAAFALGAVPAFGMLQAQQAWLSRWPRVDVALRRGLPILAAAILVWRAVQAQGAAPACH